MFERKIYQNLLDWKRFSKGRSALLIEGARRVGKTTLVEEFAKKEYDSFLIIDFSVASTQVKDAFLLYGQDIDTLLRLLQIHYGKELRERKSLIVFDEVQQFPKAREMIKHLVKDGRFDYIETGSLVSIKKNVQNIIVPSEEDRLTLLPMDFEEYLWAIGEEMLSKEIRRCLQAAAPMPDIVHRKAERLFDEYMIVGGMPQSVNAFVEDKTFFSCERIKRRILALYRDDMMKFGERDARKAIALFDAIPGQLSANSKKFSFGSLGNYARKEFYEGALTWLEDSKIVNLCRRCNDPNIGLKLTEDESSLKLYMADTGLLVSHAFSDHDSSIEIQRALQFGKISVNKGMIVENMVAQQLKASGNSLFFCDWKEPPMSNEAKKDRKREIDFLIAREFSDAAGKPRLCPIEVKSSKNYTTISLDDFRKHWNSRIGDEYVFHPKNVRVEGHRIYLPLYMACYV